MQQRTREGFHWQAWLIFGLLLGLWFVVASSLAETARRNDFLNLYSGGRLALEGQTKELHDPATQLQMERRFRPVPQLVPYVRPAFHALAFSAVAALPFGAAYWALAALSALLLIVLALLMSREIDPDIPVLIALFLPVWLGIALGQDCAVYAAIAGGAFAFAHRERHFSSGLLLSLLLAKFHLIALMPAAMIAAKRWRMLAGFTAGGAALGAVWLALVGPSGLMAYAHLLTGDDVPRVSPNPELMPNLGGLLLNAGLSHLALQALLSAVVVLFAWVAARGVEEWRWFAASILASALVLPHVYAYDLSLALPFLCAAACKSSTKHARLIAVLLCTPFPWMLNLAPQPWPGLLPLLLLSLLGSLAWEEWTRRTAAGERFRLSFAYFR